MDLLKIAVRVASMTPAVEGGMGNTLSGHARMPEAVADLDDAHDEIASFIAGHGYEGSVEVSNPVSDYESGVAAVDFIITFNSPEDVEKARIEFEARAKMPFDPYPEVRMEFKA